MDSSRVFFLILAAVSLALAACDGRPEGETSSEFVDQLPTNFDDTLLGGFIPDNTSNQNGDANANANLSDSDLDHLLGALATDGTIGAEPDGEIVEEDDFNNFSQLIQALNDSERNSLRNRIMRNIAGCNFLGAARSFDQRNCENGSVSGCNGHFLGLGRTIFRRLIGKIARGKKLGTLAQLGAVVAAESQMCAAVDFRNPQALREKMLQKRDQCMRGNIRGCIGLFFLIIKNILGAILGALLGFLG